MGGGVIHGHQVVIAGRTVPFVVERNFNGVACYPNETGEPAMDRYTCMRCNGSFTHTQDGVRWLGDPGAESELFELIRKHMTLCAMVEA